jgi:hypothetical protein
MGTVRKLRRSSLCTALVLLFSLTGMAFPAAASAAAQVTVTFAYNGVTTGEFAGTTGTPQRFVVPPAVDELSVAAFGAQGVTALVPADPNAVGGLGGSATATIAVTPGTELWVFVGGQGGFNGGAALSGGGASDVRRCSTSCVDGGSLSDRLLVAGGGGAYGGGFSIFCFCIVGATPGGAGGGPTGGSGGSSLNAGGGSGATSSAGGAGGQPLVPDPGCQVGEAGILGYGGTSGGGGGYYGGGGGAECPAGDSVRTKGPGGGGSSFGPPGTVFATGVRSGHGLVTISYTNDAPIANAGADRTLAKHQTSFALDASASHDPNNDPIVRYQWAKLDGPAGVVINDSDEATPDAQVSGVVRNTTMKFQVTVTDSHGDTSTDDVTITAPK